jgi:hypothetical protein
MFFISAQGNAYSSDELVNIHATVDAVRVGLLDTVNLTVTVDIEGASRVPKPQLPDFESFTILNESAKSQTSISIVNGQTKRTKTVTYTYLVQPNLKGTHIIDPVTIKFQGIEYKTDPITLTVVEGQVKSDNTGILPEEEAIDIEKLKGEIFILAKPEENTVFEGEQLILTYTLFSRLDIDSIALSSSPDFSGFFKEDIYNASRLEHKKEVYEEKQYDTTVLKKVALFGIEPGVYTPKPLVLEATVIAKNDDLFRFFGRPFNFLIKSNPITINVKPLPKNTTGKEFSYVVGELDVNILKRESIVNTGESTTFYLTLKSSGNLNTISDPQLKMSKRGRMYLSDTKFDRVEEQDKVNFIKKFEYTIIPEESGILEISTDDILYFDTNSSSYTDALAQPTRINVTGTDIYQEKTILTSKKEFAEGGFNFIKRNLKELKNISRDPFRSPTFYMYHLFLIAVTVILFFIKLKREKLRQDENLFKKKKARSTAMSILKEAESTINQNNYQKSINLIYQALSTYIAYKCGTPPQEITIKDSPKVLDSCFSITQEAKTDIMDMIEQCTLLKFSAWNTDYGQKVNDLYEKVMSTINNIETRRPIADQQKGNKSL